MLGNMKPAASLSSGLLARKGQARPAMRPQGFGGFGSAVAAPLEDLGWNDMGSAEPVASPAPAPAPVPVAEVTSAPVSAAPPAPAPTPVPPVLVEREALKEQVETPSPAPRPVSLATAARIGRDSAKQTKKSGKAAFTLRLDGERHLKLRLASAVTNRSAQQIVTAALDAYLVSVPEVEALLAQLPPASKAKR